MGGPAGLLAAGANSGGEDFQGSDERNSLPLRCLSGLSAFPYLYWMVSDVVDARNFVIRILTMLKRNIKLIWKKAERDKGRSVGVSQKQTTSPNPCHLPPTHAQHQAPAMTAQLLLFPSLGWRHSLTPGPDLHQWPRQFVKVVGGRSDHSSGVTSESLNPCPPQRLHRTTPQISDSSVCSRSQGPCLLMEDLRGPQTVTSSRLVKGPFSSALGGEAHSPGGAVNLYPGS